MKTTGYFDYAAATPLDPRVLEAMQPYLHEEFANPSSPHGAGRAMGQALEGARSSIAGSLGAKPTEIIFTSGSTEAIHLAVMGVMQAFPEGTALVSPIEHEAVLTSVAQMGADRVATLPIAATGIVNPEDLRAMISDTTALVCVQYANNEIGAIQPIAKIAAMLSEVRRDRTKRGVALPIYLLCDAAQAGLLNLQVSRLGVDLLTMGGSKLYGPPGSGFLYVRTGTELAPVMGGGGQERGLRGGTPNVQAAVGLAAALHLVQAGREAESKRLGELRDHLWAEIKRSISGGVLSGAEKPRVAGNLNVSFEGCDGETLVAHLDAAGYAVATGSACAAANEDPSHVLLAIGRSHDQAASSLRISMGRFTTGEEVAAFALKLAEVVATVRSITASQHNRLQ